MWTQCPYKWKLNYIDEVGKFSDNIHTLFGTSMHEVLQTYLTTMYTDTIKAADALDLNEMLLTQMKENFVNTLKRNGGVEFCNQNDMGEFYQHGLLILEWFKKKRGMYFNKKGYELVGTVGFKSPLANIRNLKNRDVTYIFTDANASITN